MFDEPTKQEDRIVGLGAANSPAVDFMPMAIGGKIIAHQRFRQAVPDDREVQLVEIPIVLCKQRSCLPLDRKSVVAIVHEDEVYPIRGMNGIEIYQSR